jgi:SPX domain protein involved in polyphosphate accumulation
MVRFGDQSRYEYKYIINATLALQVKDFIKPYTQMDSHLREAGHQQYTVRSVYFDTPALDYYYEKMDGVKIRKKLRVRTYDDTDDYAFLEIKRKYVNCVAKERSRLSILTIERLINAPENNTYEFPQDDYNARLVSGKFLYNLLKKGLVPTLLVVYEREAYIEKGLDKNRVTIDTNVRVLSKPDLSELMDTDNFVTVTDDRVILELKFDDMMPQWMKNLTAEFRLKKQSISKYCLGIDACRDAFKDGETL